MLLGAEFGVWKFATFQGFEVWSLSFIMYDGDSTVQLFKLPNFKTSKLSKLFQTSILSKLPNFKTPSLDIVKFGKPTDVPWVFRFWSLERLEVSKFWKFGSLSLEVSKFWNQPARQPASQPAGRPAGPPRRGVPEHYLPPPARAAYVQLLRAWCRGGFKVQF